jgi:hypothetical protein
VPLTGFHFLLILVLVLTLPALRTKANPSPQPIRIPRVIFLGNWYIGIRSRNFYMVNPNRERIPTVDPNGIKSR